jgi:hypothetical protein
MSRFAANLKFGSGLNLKVAQALTVRAELGEVAMRNGPEFLAIAVWGLFASAIAVAQGAGSFQGSKPADQAPAVSMSENINSDKLITGRSSARSATGPYGNLFIDPSLQDERPALQGPKPTSADLVSQ